MVEAMTKTEQTSSNIVEFPVGRRGLPAFTDPVITYQLLALGNALAVIAESTPYPLWVGGLAQEVKRVARKMK